MAKLNQRRVLRNYRSLTPTKFYVINQRVRTNLADNANIPESTWAANPTLLSSYLALSDRHAAVYHESLQGSKLVIAERDALQAQLIDHLDEIASFLEAAAIRTPDVLLVSGFDLARERRSVPRPKVPPPAADSFQAEQPSS